MHVNVNEHEILVLLLRLRQVCCHPALICKMLDQEDVKESGIMENVDVNLLSREHNVSLDAIDEIEEDIGIDQKVTKNQSIAENLVFDDNRTGSKVSDNYKLSIN